MTVAKVGASVDEKFTVSVETAEPPGLSDIKNSLAGSLCGVGDFETMQKPATERRISLR